MEFNGQIEWSHPSGNFLVRPDIKRGNTTSGLVLRQENFYIDSVQTLVLAGGIQNVDFLSDTFGTQGFPVSHNRRIKIYPTFAYLSFHQNATPPSEWICRLYKNSVSVASGWVRWHGSTNGIIWGHKKFLTGNQDANTIFGFTPVVPNRLVGDRWSIGWDNDGSGTQITNILARVSLGFTILDNDPD
jgi:hypothetical protein